MTTTTLTAGDDTYFATTEFEYVLGLEGNDTLSGAEVFGVTLVGGLGDDVLSVYGVGAVLTDSDGFNRFKSYAENVQITTLGGYNDIYLYAAGATVNVGQEASSVETVNTIETSLGADNAQITALSGASQIYLHASAAVVNAGGDYTNIIKTYETSTGSTFVLTSISSAIENSGNNNTFTVSNSLSFLNFGANGTTLTFAGTEADIQGYGNNANIVSFADYASQVTWIGTSCTLQTGSGRDTLHANLISSSVDLGGGDDEVNITANDTEVRGGSGNDIVNVGIDVGSMSIIGNRLYGDEGDDGLIGSNQADTLDGGDGIDRMIGRGGDDTFYVTDGDTAYEQANEGNDTVIVMGTYVFLDEDIENIYGGLDIQQILIGNSSDNLIVSGNGGSYADGQSGNDTLVGGNGADELWGYADDDILRGNAGNDNLDGGVGQDSMLGGAGNDDYVVDDLGDTVTEFANEGTDSVSTMLASYALGSDVENLIGVAVTGQSLTGNSLANMITGGSGNDTIDGGIGVDTVAGSGGDDTYIVDNAADTVSEAMGSGTDTVVTALASYTLSAEVENLTGTASAAQTLSGNALANVITADSGNDTLSGAGGNDQLSGGDGNDLLNGGAGADVLNGGAGIDSVDYSGSVALTAALDGSVASSGAAAGDTFSGMENLSGSSVADTLIGNSANNVILGRAGADTIIGGLGVDTLAGDVGADRFVYRTAAEGGDIITSFAADDFLAFTSAGFNNIAVGALNKSMFRSAPTLQPRDSNDYFLFNTTNDTLWFDVDGNGAGAAVFIADFTNDFNLVVVTF